MGQAHNDVYRDSRERLNDQKDPRYASDPLFRQQVVEKLQRFAGGQLDATGNRSRAVRSDDPACLECPLQA